jgi:hypothetical protein
MATAHLDPLLRFIHKLAIGYGALQRTDRQLLNDFSTHHDEAAFAALVARHGSMVLRVCRHMTSPLGQEGRFRIEGLIPGLKYELHASKQGYAMDIIAGKSKDLTINAGETQDLGVVQVKVKE